MTKYRLTEETINFNGTTLHRIQCVTGFDNVKSGDLGGWIEKESNLSQDGDAWVYEHARVYRNALVSGNARVYGNAWVSGNARVYGNAEVSGDARVSWAADVYGNASVYGDARVSWAADVYGNAEVYGNARVSGNARVFGNARVYGNAEVLGDAEITSESDYMVFKNSWSSGRYFTYTISNKKWKVGCFDGTGEELIKKAYQDSELKGKCYETIVKAAEAIANLTQSGVQKQKS